MPTVDPQKRRQHVANYAARHPDRIKVRAAAYREEHRNELAEKQRRYAAENADKIRAKTARYRARKRAERTTTTND